MEGVPTERSNQYTNAMSDVEESDSDGELFLVTNIPLVSLTWKHCADSVSHIDATHQRYAGRPKSLNIAQSLPVTMPAIVTDRDIVHVDYDEVSLVLNRFKIVVKSCLKRNAQRFTKSWLSEVQPY